MTKQDIKNLLQAIFGADYSNYVEEFNDLFLVDFPEDFDIDKREDGISEMLRDCKSYVNKYYTMVIQFDDFEVSISFEDC